MARICIGFLRILVGIGLVVAGIHFIFFGLICFLMGLVGEPEPMTYSQIFASGLGSLVIGGFGLKCAVKLLAGLKEPAPGVRYEVCGKCGRRRAPGQCDTCGYDPDGPRQAKWVFGLFVVPLAFLAWLATGTGSSASEMGREIGCLIFLADFFATVWCVCLWRRGRI